MPINPISGANTPIITNQSDRSKLDQFTFLRLLLTQLATQNPLEPMDDKDLSAQLTQMSQVQGMENLQDSMRRLQAATLIGKQVEGFDLDGKPVSGIVDSIEPTGTAVFLHVGATTIELSQLTKISEPPKQS